MLVANFLAGLIVGILLGLALAPVLRSWVLWQVTKEAREASAPSPDLRSTNAER